MAANWFRRCNYSALNHAYQLWPWRCFGKIHGMTSSPNLDQMTPEQLRALAAQLLSKVDTIG